MSKTYNINTDTSVTNEDDLSTNTTNYITDYGIITPDMTTTTPYSTLNGTYYCHTVNDTEYTFYIQHKPTGNFYKTINKRFIPYTWKTSKKLIGYNDIEIEFTKYLNDAKKIVITSTSKPSDFEVLDKVGLSEHDGFIVVCVCENYINDNNWTSTNWNTATTTYCDDSGIKYVNTGDTFSAMTDTNNLKDINIY